MKWNGPYRPPTYPLGSIHHMHNRYNIIILGMNGCTGLFLSLSLSALSASLTYSTHLAYMLQFSINDDEENKRSYFPRDSDRSCLFTNHITSHHVVVDSIDNNFCIFNIMVPFYKMEELFYDSQPLWTAANTRDLQQQHKQQQTERQAAIVHSNTWINLWDQW